MIPANRAAVDIELSLRCIVPSAPYPDDSARTRTSAAAAAAEPPSNSSSAGSMISVVCLRNTVKWLVALWATPFVVVDGE